MQNVTLPIPTNCFIMKQSTSFNLYVRTLTLLDHYRGVPPPSDIRDAAAAAAVGTTPVETPGLDRWSSLRN